MLLRLSPNYTISEDGEHQIHVYRYEGEVFVFNSSDLYPFYFGKEEEKQCFRELAKIIMESDNNRMKAQFSSEFPEEVFQYQITR